MFRIPDFFQVEMSFDDATKTISRLTEGGLLEGLEYMNKKWDEHCNADDADDDDFWGMWCYECSAFNIVFNKMSPLFVEKV